LREREREWRGYVEKVVSFLFHVNLLDKSRNTKTGKQKKNDYSEFDLKIIVV
jgi:hypothetical protein